MDQWFVVCFAEMPQKCANEQGNIFFPFAQRRHDDAHDVQAKEKIVAEFSLTHERFEILVGGGDEPDVRAQGLIAADTLESALLADHAQQFDLRAGADFGHFVEKNCTAICLFEPANAPLMRAGERTFLVTE